MVLFNFLLQLIILLCICFMGMSDPESKLMIFFS